MLRWAPAAGILVLGLVLGLLAVPFLVSPGQLAEEQPPSETSQPKLAAPERAATQAVKGAFEIRVLDAATGRGVPLVTFETVHHVSFVTDNAGRIAVREPALLGEKVFFFIHAPGYQVPRDGLGMAGQRLNIEPGGKAEVALQRDNLAERLYRVTGAELYRDSLLLKKSDLPLANPNGWAKVAGQDSVQAAPYRNQLYWFWGDTNRLAYPLGNFRTAGATSQLPGAGGLPPERGIEFRYFTGENGFAKKMADLPEREGVVWLDGLCTVQSAEGTARLVAHFSRRKGLKTQLAHGLVAFDDTLEQFVPLAAREPDDTWRFVRDHPLETHQGQQAYLEFGNPFPVTRVPANLDSAIDAARYESFTCLPAGANADEAPPLRTAQGELDWQWRHAPPVTQRTELRWLNAGLVKPDELRWLPENAAQPGERVLMHSGTVRWNAFRQRYVMIAVEDGFDRPGPSALGEVWYAEAQSPQGPFARAVKVLTHDKQSFYNPCHHPFFDEAGGRHIYFEGTYTNTFTQSPPTPRYDYNQIMYRLDLDHPALKAAFPRSPNP